jgi:hypothetical protein
MPDFIAQGIDYAWGRPRYGSLRSAGVDFVERYASRDTAKDLMPPEQDALDRGGVPYGLVYETTANRALSGRVGGIDDAKRADQRRRQLGYPNMPVHFAVDFDAQGSQLAEVAAYVAGAASVLGHDETGAYGGYFVIQYLAERNVCRWHWQTYAWSRGLIFGLKIALSRPLGKLVVPGAHIYQFRNGVTVAGVSCDWNKATAEGMHSLRGKGFRPPALPKPQKYGSRSLKQGDRGDDVKELQRILSTLGSPFVTQDGVYGLQTEKAKHDAMWKLGWPSLTIKARDKTRSIGIPGLKALKHPKTRPQSYKDREKQRRQK